MAHQVFLSYATEDADTASAVCALLEADGIECWVAPRDVKAGTDYAAAIMSAIRNSRLVVLIFSTHSNVSPYALREVERAVAYGRPVLAVRTDQIDPSPSLEYYVHEWIEAPGGVKGRRKEIIAAVRQQSERPPLATKHPGGGLPSGRTPAGRARRGVTGAGSRARGGSWRTWGMVVAAGLVIAALGLGLGLGLKQDRVASGVGTANSHIAWTELGPSITVPSARGAHSLTQDVTSGRLIMFGGYDGTTELNDTWAYDPSADKWTEFEPSDPQPSARSGHSAAHDPVTRRLIVFGGNGTGRALNDTWSYDSATNTWTELHTRGSVPSPRASSAMAYDPITRRLIMFGGLDEAGASVNDTWAYNPPGGAWTELQPADTKPPGRSGHSMAYDPTARRVIIFGGRGDAGNCLGDTWAYDATLNTWTELHPVGPLPSPRDGQSMAYDLTSGRLIMFGGSGSSGATLDDAWGYDFLANTWTRLEASGTQPSARARHAMVYDPASGQMIMFGGHSIGPWDFRNDVWACGTA